MTALHRNSVFWWLYVVVLAGVALFILYSVVGMLVLGLFGYYATRPICHRYGTVVESNWLAAALTVVTVLLPVFALSIYAVVRVFQQIQRLFDESVVSLIVERLVGLDAVPITDTSDLESVLRNPPSLEQLARLLSESAVQEGIRVADAVFGAIILLALALTLSYALLVYDSAIAQGFAKLAGGRDTTVSSYARAVDVDLESVFFGNLLFVVVMSVLATATYAATNLVSPPGLDVPMVVTLGVLTGVASLIPLVVGKVIYLPVVAYLAVRASQDGTGQLVFVGGVLIVYFLVLDILPQSFVQPYISGRQLNPMLLLFAYILGPILFGWYGFFLMPIIAVLLLELLRIVLPELLHGDAIVPEPELAAGVGASSDEIHSDDSEETVHSDNSEETDSTGTDTDTTQS